MAHPNEYALVVYPSSAQSRHYHSGITLDVPEGTCPARMTNIVREDGIFAAFSIIRRDIEPAHVLSGVFVAERNIRRVPLAEAFAACADDGLAEVTTSDGEMVAVRFLGYAGLRAEDIPSYARVVQAAWSAFYVPLTDGVKTYGPYDMVRMP